MLPVFLLVAFVVNSIPMHRKIKNFFLFSSISVNTRATIHISAIKTKGNIMLKRTNTLPYTYSNAVEFTTERDETIYVDNIIIFDNDGYPKWIFNDMLVDAKGADNCITEYPTKLKRRGSADLSNNIIQIVPSVNGYGETYKMNNKTVYTIFVPDSLAGLEYGTCAQLSTYSAYIHTMYFIFGGNVHTRYINIENIGSKLNEYHDYFKNPSIFDGKSIDELATKAQEYKAEYERVKKICDAFEPEHTENVTCKDGFIKYIG